MRVSDVLGSSAHQLETRPDPSVQDTMRIHPQDPNWNQNETIEDMPSMLEFLLRDYTPSDLKIATAKLKRTRDSKLQLIVHTKECTLDKRSEFSWVYNI